MYAPEQLSLLIGIIKLNAIPANYSGMHVYTPQGIPEKAILHVLSLREKMLGCVVSLIPTMVYMYILNMLIKFCRCEKANLFDS
jgi:hypothetical protein